jgi:heparosan-N-sulfate-glucuronate 5-epimerase
LAAAARLALSPLFTAQAAGGVGGELGGLPWPEEYPTTPQSHVLNGAIFALWGIRDVALGLGSEDAREQFERVLDSLAANLHRFDTGTWSLYSLFPHPIFNRASSFYHDLHINQLTAMQILAPRPEFERVRARWSAYAGSRYARSKAFAWKAAFRILVPRNRLFARAAPWTRR